MTDYKFCKVEREGPLTIVTLNRPEVMNALHPPQHFELDSIFNDFANEKMLGHDEQINDRKRLEIVIHQKEIWVVARSQALTFHLESAVGNAFAKVSLLTLEFELFSANSTKEVCKRTIVREGGYFDVAAMRAVRPRAHPGFRPRASILRAAGVGRLRLFEAEFHRHKLAELD